MAVFIDAKTTLLAQALKQQCEWLGVNVHDIHTFDVKKLPPLETAYIFGEADEYRENIRLYHHISEQKINAQRTHFICMADMGTTDELRKTQHKGFSLALDKPVTFSKLTALFFPKEQPQHTPQLSTVTFAAHILVVEDGEANLAVVLALLEHQNINADVARNGQEALALIQKKQYPLILMDLAMPIMDGLEATALIRSGNSQNKETPIIALTANAFAEDRAACLAAGMNDYMSKPIDTKIFQQKINQWLHQPQFTTKPNTGHLSPTKPTKNTHTQEPLVDTRILQQLIKDTSVSSIGVILGIFFKELEERIPTMELLLSQEIWASLGDEAHILKSSAASFGAITLAAKAKIIELNVKTENYSAVRDAMEGIDLLAHKTILAERDFLKHITP